MAKTNEGNGIVNSGSSSWQGGGDEATRQTLVDYLDAVAVTPLLRAVAERSMQALGSMPGARVLDVGCGGGVFLPFLAGLVEQSGRVIGLDHAPDFVDTARRRMSELGLDNRVEVMEGDALDLPFPDAAFDAAHCERLLMHLEDPATALREMRRVVRPGGSVVVVETDWAGLRVDHPDREVLDALFQRWLVHVRQPAMGLELRRRLTEAGLIDVQAEPVIAGSNDVRLLYAYGLDLNGAAGLLAEEGKLERSRSEAAIAWLNEASQTGTFFAYGGLILARGTVPAR
jgi:ubiquinone/menaquinone biosynthesis C-methylase UbiE